MLTQPSPMDGTKFPLQGGVEALPIIAVLRKDATRISEHATAMPLPAR
jgi:hypothetical protein